MRANSAGGTSADRRRVPLCSYPAACGYESGEVPTGRGGATMETDETLATIEGLLADLYHGREEISRDEIYRHMTGDKVPPDAQAYFAHLAEGDYTLEELVDELGLVE
jgi:hypothetical protein